MDGMLGDARFAHVARDPKFRRIPKAERKVKIDRRFKGMFNDEKFTVRYTVDKRGRPVNRTTTEDLRKYYDLSSGEDSEDDVDSEDASVPSASKRDSEKKMKDTKKRRKDEKKAAKEIKSETDSVQDPSDTRNKDDCSSSRKRLSGPETKVERSDDDTEFSDSEESIKNEFSQAELDEQLHQRREDENDILTNEIKEKLKDLTVNYARGEGVLLTDSSSEEESTEASDVEEEIEHNWGELDKDAETTDEITHRLAICNMDWDRIRAVDLMILLNSFLPSGGLIRSITVIRQNNNN